MAQKVCNLLVVGEPDADFMSLTCEVKN